MKINTNKWNRIRYTMWSPGYDLIGRVFALSRKKSIDSLQIIPGDKVLIIGAGTGLDLEFLPAYCEITAIDLTPSMLERLKKRNLVLGLHVKAITMDAHSLDFEDNSFDKIILHLILAVIPDPVSCIREASRVLKKGGTATVFDKFVPTGRKVSFRRKLANFFANIIASDLTRDFESIVAESDLRVLSDEDAGWNGNFRLIKLTKG
jgi:phosphatidylethanolamine/phosphatidyl-N-methylethanolamine N-methyltransferase